MKFCLAQRDTVASAAVLTVNRKDGQVDLVGISPAERGREKGGEGTRKMAEKGAAAM